MTGAPLDEVDLSALGTIPPDYRHVTKSITPGPGLALLQAYLKWYDVRQPDVEIPVELDAEGRDFLRAEVEAGRLAIDGELGFVICHRCGDSFSFLLVCTWRNQNEMWETVYGQDVAAGGGFALIPQGTHLEVICVWELGAVLHEQQAWSRYLRSARDEPAKRAYLTDQHTGSV